MGSTGNVHSAILQFVPKQHSHSQYSWNRNRQTEWLILHPTLEIIEQLPERYRNIPLVEQVDGHNCGPIAARYLWRMISSEHERFQSDESFEGDDVLGLLICFEYRNLRDCYDEILRVRASRRYIRSLERDSTATDDDNNDDDAAVDENDSDESDSDSDDNDGDDRAEGGASGSTGTGRRGGSSGSVSSASSVNDDGGSRRDMDARDNVETNNDDQIDQANSRSSSARRQPHSYSAMRRIDSSSRHSRTEERRMNKCRCEALKAILVRQEQPSSGLKAELIHFDATTD